MSIFRKILLFMLNCLTRQSPRKASPFDTLESILAGYKRQTYTQLSALPETSELTHAGLPEHSTLTLHRNLQADGKLEIVLTCQFWISAAEHERRQAEQLQGVIDAMAQMPGLTEAERERALAEMTNSPYQPLRHPTNPDLVSSFGQRLYFDMLPDGTLIEDEFTRSQQAENETIEQADWIGATGLGEDTERELPRYLRLEYGESILDDDSLKAAELTYLGAFEPTKADIKQQFSEGTTLVHCWTIPSENEMYAYVEIFRDGETCMGMGGYLPEAARL